jgi:hypothetical protein
MTTPARILLVAVALSLGCDLEATLESQIVEEGATAGVTVRNTTEANIAFGGCNPAHFEERLPGRWVLDNLLRPACASDLRLENGQLPAFAYTIVPPGQTLTLSISTHWVSQLPAIVRGNFAVKTQCSDPLNGGFVCDDIVRLTSDPVVVVEVGTIDTRRRS